MSIHYWLQPAQTLQQHIPQILMAIVLNVVFFGVLAIRVHDERAMQAFRARNAARHAAAKAAWAHRRTETPVHRNNLPVATPVPKGTNSKPSQNELPIALPVPSAPPQVPLLKN